MVDCGSLGLLTGTLDFQSEIQGGLSSLDLLKILQLNLITGMLGECFSFLSNSELIKIGLLNKTFFLLSRNNHLWAERYPKTALLASRKACSIFYLHWDMSNSYQFKGSLDRYCYNPIAFACDRIIGQFGDYVKILDVKNKCWSIVKPITVGGSLIKSNFTVSTSHNLIICGNGKRLTAIPLNSLKPSFLKLEGQDVFSNCKITNSRVVTWPANRPFFCVWKYKPGLKGDQIIHIKTFIAADSIDSSPIVKEGVLVVKSSSGLRVWDLKKCTIRHEIGLETSGCVRKKLFQGCLYQQDKYGNVHQTSLRTGIKLGTYGHSESRMNCKGIAVNEKYIVSLGKSSFTAYNRHSCNKVFSQKFQNDQLTKCKIAGDRILIAIHSTSNSMVRIYQATTGYVLQNIALDNFSRIWKIYANDCALVVGWESTNLSLLGGGTDLYMLASKKFPTLKGDLAPPIATQEELEEEHNRLEKLAPGKNADNDWCKQQ